MNISCKISTAEAFMPLGLEVWIDDLLIFNFNQLKESLDVNYDISDADGEHELRFVLKNKTKYHTKIDKEGNIVNDSVLVVSDLKFENIELGQLFYDKAVYKHSNNSAGEAVDDKFYGRLGCNGTVTLKFSTPIYLWLLENM